MTKIIRPKILEYRQLIMMEQNHWALSIVKAGYIKYGYPYFEMKDKHNKIQLENWCKDNIEKGYWDMVSNIFFFTSDEDALAFKLTWE